MESSPERLATICVGYRKTFWMKRNAHENNFAFIISLIFVDLMLSLDLLLVNTSSYIVCKPSSIAETYMYM